MNYLDRQAAEVLADQMRQEPWVLRVQVLPVGDAVLPWEGLPRRHYSCWVTGVEGSTIIVDVEAWERWKHQRAGSRSRLGSHRPPESVRYKGIWITVKTSEEVPPREEASWTWEGQGQQRTSASRHEALANAQQALEEAIIQRREGNKNPPRSS